MIGIIAAMEDEMSILLDKLNLSVYEQVCGCRFYLGKVNETDVVLTTCGVGKVNAAIAATVMIEFYECKLIINTGIAGGITGVNTKDVIIGSKLMYHDFDVTAFGYEYGQVPGMPKSFMPTLDSVIMFKKILNELGIDYKEAVIYSGDKFVTSKDVLANLDISMPCIAEMEGAAIAHVCVKSGIDFIVVRYVSDIVGKTSQIDDYKTFEKEMATRSSEICLHILNKFA